MSIPSGIVDSCRCHEVRQHPRRRWTSLRRSAARRTEQARDSGITTRKRPQAAHRNSVRSHSHRRPLPRRIRRNWSDEQASTAVGVLERAVAWFAERGVTVERVLSNNGSAYRSHDGGTSALGSASDTSGHAPTGRRRTGRSSDSTAPSGTAGPMPGFTLQKPNDAWRCPAGSTSTTTTDTTQRLAAHPSTDSTTSLDITSRAPDTFVAKTSEGLGETRY